MTNTEFSFIRQTDSEAARPNRQSYTLQRAWRSASGVVLRAVLARDSVPAQSFARVDVLSEQRTWTTLATFDGPTIDRWTASPYAQDVVPADELGKVADDLLRRAVSILGTSALQGARNV